MIKKLRESKYGDKEYLGVKNQFNYDIYQLEIDHKNKTIKKGQFVMLHKGDYRTRKEMASTIDDLKKKGYKLVESKTGRLKSKVNESLVVATDILNTFSKLNENEDYSWYSIDLPKEKTKKLKPFLRNSNIYFEPSENGNFIHFEIKVVSDKVKKMINQALNEDLEQDDFNSNEVEYKGKRIVITNSGCSVDGREFATEQDAEEYIDNLPKSIKEAYDLTDTPYATLSEITKFIKDNVEYFKVDGKGGYASLPLDDTYKVYIGWLGGYDHVYEDAKRNGAIVDEDGYGLNIGIKLSDNDAMYFDYEQLEMPYYEDGEVVDYDHTISRDYDVSYLAKMIVDEYNKIFKNLVVNDEGMIIEQDADIEVDDELNDDYKYEELSDELLNENTQAYYYYENPEKLMEDYNKGVSISMKPYSLEEVFTVGEFTSKEKQTLRRAIKEGRCVGNNCKETKVCNDNDVATDDGEENLAMNKTDDDKKKLNEKVYLDGLDEFKPWYKDAVEEWDLIIENDKLDALEFLLDDIYPDGIGITELNDLLRFEQDWLNDSLGIEVQEEEEEDF